MKLIDNELIDFYKNFFRIRKTEEKISKEYHLGEIRCPVHLSIGQETVSVAFSMTQQLSDTAISTHRAHAHYLAKGGNLNKMIAEIYGKVTGCSRGRGGSMHLVDKDVGFIGSSAIVGNSIPVGVGYSLAKKLNNDNSITYIFLGDGAIEEGSFYESINFAILKNLKMYNFKLPIVSFNSFTCLFLLCKIFDFMMTDHILTLFSISYKNTRNIDTLEERDAHFIIGKNRRNTEKKCH
jgi:TPP-dependent pyruvate/acetoin dehydrogenase alpha subunit